MSAYRVIGKDTGGREVRMSPVFADWWTEYCDALGFTPTIVQGGWMGDLAADASGPTHDGDALDLRVWDRTQREVEAMVREAREMSGAAWLRNKIHGGFPDPHVHLAPGRWAHPSPSALAQWNELRNGGDGLKGNGSDYHPYPLAPTWENDMAFTDADRKTLNALVTAVAGLATQIADTRKALGLRVSKEADEVVEKLQG